MEVVQFQTNTSVWSLVFHKVTQHSVEVWAGTLFGTLRKPKAARLIIYRDGTELARQEIRTEDWQRPITRLNQRFYDKRVFTNLQAGQRYTVKFFQRLEGPDYEGKDLWQTLNDGTFTTLPTALPSSKTKPFTVSLSSCFYEHRDSGRAASAFKALYDRGDMSVQPDIKFMVGDQVYLDIGLDSLSPLTNEVRQRVAEDYAKHWQTLGSMLTRGGAWMLPDDHEYWNDYPFYDSLVPTLFMLKIAKIRHAWRQASSDGVNNVQCSTKIDTFNLGDNQQHDIAFCVADLRSYRSKTQFIDNAGFSQLMAWAQNLRCPGVLVIPQILIVEGNEQERNLLSFKKQYTDLVSALASTGHDIVVLSGDVHFGRIAQVKLGTKGGRLIEVVSSPMSNLTGVNSIATDAPKSTPKQFPDPKAVNIAGVAPQDVQYDKRFNVSTKNGFPLSAYWCERTLEHFMTVSFYKKEGVVNMSVQAWRIREEDAQRLPKADFTTPFTASLR
ncbi:MAG: hypothetical protein GW763_12790 [Paraglaciecola sp.]|nr:hypothetical protein [Paraglaciecola sp.]NCT48837.1 hypothetical protein [Paraglaciecola sp.]